MKTREQIIILAKKAYNQYFKNDYNEIMNIRRLMI